MFARTVALQVGKLAMLNPANAATGASIHYFTPNYKNIHDIIDRKCMVTFIDPDTQSWINFPTLVYNIYYNINFIFLLLIESISCCLYMSHIIWRFRPFNLSCLNSVEIGIAVMACISYAGFFLLIMFLYRYYKDSRSDKYKTENKLNSSSSSVDAILPNNRDAAIELTNQKSKQLE